ncbi:hypothetical protein [Actinotalea sp. C106]|uniref:hypothetical protein n=1 Tax=Actinotalea sp. C106 TaxID=2908644 RepID=UPI00202776BC|nr:hypothetical protein [Actinotalea sp. C106]
MTTLSHEPRAVASAVVLYGIHPLRGYAVTWHLTPLPAVPARAGRRPGGAQFVVERADGHITDSLAWQLAEKEVAVLGVAEVSRLVRSATHRRR